ncbi:hypothetical protein SV7mr_18120 [Stieleria bergensis]|uniref:Uncharacterized protein n=1 Tax=Stieleria bergensis TaxID=2528025 RepID=A0A517ST52_9BACT|nr:hypothetical protein SV7mr_18120 [Planctomycetes bacterium SV_7m_r]
MQQTLATVREYQRFEKGTETYFHIGIRAANPSNRHPEMQFMA